MSERYEKRICQNPECGRIFYADLGGRANGKKPYPIRVKSSKTCSVKCSSARNAVIVKKNNNKFRKEHPEKIKQYNENFKKKNGKKNNTLRQ